MSAMPWEMSWFSSPAALVAFSAFLGLLLVVFVYCLTVTVAKPQDGRPKKHRRRGNKRNGRAFVLLEPLEHSRSRSPVQTDMDAVHEIAQEFNKIIENINTYLDTFNCETPEDNDSSWTTIMASEVRSSSSASLSPSREDPHNSIMTSKASSSAEVSRTHASDNSPTFITASNVGFSSWVSLPTLVYGEDMAHASSMQPVLRHPSAGPEDQSDPATHPPCPRRSASCPEASSLQQHQQDFEIQLGAPTAPPEVPKVHSRDMEMHPHHNKGQETLQGLIAECKPEQELGLPANVDETPQNIPASALPTPQRREKCDVMVVPIVQDLPFLDMAVKRKLEHHIDKMKTQRYFGLQMRMMECEKSFENILLR